MWNPFKVRILTPAMCPNCQCAHGITVAQACKHAAGERVKDGHVVECVRCSTHYTITSSGEIIIHLANKVRPDAPIAMPGGALDGRAGWVDDDLPDLTLRG